MTGIADETFRNLTEPVMSDIYKCKPAFVTACEPSDARHAKRRLRIAAEILPDRRGMSALFRSGFTSTLFDASGNAGKADNTLLR